MNAFTRLCGTVLLLWLAGSAMAQGQGTTDEAAVWTVIERQWRAQQRGDKNWVNELLAADFVGWPNESPAPRNKTSTRLWTDFNARQSETLEYELYPQAILVHGDVAVAHYLYTTATQRKDDDLQVSSGRYTDVLVRVEGDWKFISWHGGDDS